jgi:hypothetical protein
MTRGITTVVGGLPTKPPHRGAMSGLTECFHRLLLTISHIVVDATKGENHLIASMG